MLAASDFSLPNRLQNASHLFGESSTAINRFHNTPGKASLFELFRPLDLPPNRSASVVVPSRCAAQVGQNSAVASNGVMALRRKCLFALNQATLPLLASRAIEQSRREFQPNELRAPCLTFFLGLLQRLLDSRAS